METEFVKWAPALFVRREEMLIIGDLHIGRDVALAKSGIHMPDANERLISSILSLAEQTCAKGIVLLGDVKESIGYPPKEEYGELSRLFYELRKIPITITKGNHDARIAEIIKRLGANAIVVKELLLERVALMHGNALPSQEAMAKDWIITGHSHPAMEIGGRLEKVFVVSKVSSSASRMYKRYNKKAEIVVMPAFNELISGSNPASLSDFSPQFKRKIFEIRKAKIYNLGKELVTRL